MKIRHVIFLITILIISRPFNAALMEKKKEFKDTLFKIINTFTREYFARYDPNLHEPAKDQQSEDSSKQLNQIPKPKHTFSFKNEDPVISTEDGSVHKYQRSFYRFPDSASNNDPNNTQKPSEELLFTLTFEITSNSEELVVLFIHKIVTARKIIQYILPLEQIFAKNSIKKTLFQFYDKLDQTISFFDTFIDDIKHFKNILETSENPLTQFKMKVLEANKEDVESKYFDIAAEKTRMAAKDVYNTNLFSSNGELNSKLSTEIQNSDNSSEKKDALKIPPEFIFLSFESIKYKQFGDVEVLCFFHQEQKMFTMIMKSHYFTFESDFNIMTRGFIVENISANLQKIESEVFDKLIQLQGNSSDDFSIQLSEKSFGEDFKLIEKEPFSGFKCYFSENLGMGFCPKENSEAQTVVRIIYSSIGQNGDLNVNLLDQENTEVVQSLENDKKEEKSHVFSYPLYYIERAFPKKSIFDINVFFDAMKSEMILASDGFSVLAHSSKNSEDQIKIPVKNADLQSFKIHTFIDSPKCYSVFSSNRGEDIWTLNTKEDKNTASYELEFKIEGKELTSKWKKLTLNSNWPETDKVNDKSGETGNKSEDTGNKPEDTINQSQININKPEDNINKPKDNIDIPEDNIDNLKDKQQRRLKSNNKLNYSFRPLQKTQEGSFFLNKPNISNRKLFISKPVKRMNIVAPESVIIENEFQNNSVLDLTLDSTFKGDLTNDLFSEINKRTNQKKLVKNEKNKNQAFEQNFESEIEKPVGFSDNEEDKMNREGLLKKYKPVI